MRQPGRAHYGIDRAGGDAQRAADACLLVDERGSFWLGNPMGGIQRERTCPQQFRQLANALLASRRTLIDLGASFCNSGGIGFASIETALATLSLWQHGVDFRYQRILFHSDLPRNPAVGPFISGVASARAISLTNSGPL